MHKPFIVSCITKNLLTRIKSSMSPKNFQRCGMWSRVASVLHYTAEMWRAAEAQSKRWPTRRYCGIKQVTHSKHLTDTAPYFFVLVFFFFLSECIQTHCHESISHWRRASTSGRTLTYARKPVVEKQKSSYWAWRGHTTLSAVSRVTVQSMSSECLVSVSRRCGDTRTHTGMAGLWVAALTLMVKGPAVAGSSWPVTPQASVLTRSLGWWNE